MEPDVNSTARTGAKPFPLRLALLHVSGIVALYALFGVILFAAAGRLDWLDAWIFLAAYCAIAVGVALWLLRRDPALVLERDTAIAKQDAKPWDKRLVVLNWVLTLLLFAVIGLDAGRLRLSAVPPALRAVTSASGCMAGPLASLRRHDAPATLAPPPGAAAIVA